MNNFLPGQPWALKLVWAVNVQNYTILPGTLGTVLKGTVEDSFWQQLEPTVARGAIDDNNCQ